MEPPRVSEARRPSLDQSVLLWGLFLVLRSQYWDLALLPCVSSGGFPSFPASCFTNPFLHHLAACPASSALFPPSSSSSHVSPCYNDSLSLSPSHTGKAPDTPLAQPPTSEKDAQNKTEQRGELPLQPVSPTRLTVHPGMSIGPFRNPSTPKGLLPRRSKTDQGKRKGAQVPSAQASLSSESPALAHQAVIPPGC